MELGVVIDRIDRANGEDPNRFEDRPLALVQGQRATQWVEQLCADTNDPPAPVVMVAARAHHLRRWEFPRSEYPAGRSGYLRWRRDAKQRHADLVDELLVDATWAIADRDRVAALITRQGLGSDPQTQLVEDAACLVFLETQYDDMLARTERDKMVRVVAKTLAKMSPAAIALAAQLELSELGADVVAEAAATETP